MKSKILYLLLFLITLGACQRPAANDAAEKNLINFIAELKETNTIDGHYIILAHNSCQGCRKIIQQYAASLSTQKELPTLIVRDIKNLVLLNKEFKDYPGFLYLDSLELYEKSQLTLPLGISIAI